jgi:pilus assembly protein CpaE
MSVYLLQSGVDAEKFDEVERVVRRAIPDLNLIGGVEEVGLRSMTSGGKSVVLLVVPTAEKGYFAKLAELLTRSRGGLFFIVIGGEFSASEYKQLVQSGNADWVHESGLPHEVLDIVARVAAPVAKDSNETRPVVTSFIPSSGGVGNSTLAIETAIQLAKHKISKGRKVCLIDLDFQSSHVCDYLDIGPRFQVEDLISAPDRLDDQLLDAFVTPHASGIEVMGAPRSRFSMRDLTVEGLSALFEIMAKRYAYFVVDLPLATHTWTVPVLSASEVVFVTGVNTIPALRQIGETVGAIRAESGVSAKVQAIVNRCEFGLLGGVVRGDHVTRILADEKPIFVRESARALECLNVGTSMTLTSPSDKVVKDIAALVEIIAAGSAVGAKKKRDR